MRTLWRSTPRQTTCSCRSRTRGLVCMREGTDRTSGDEDRRGAPRSKNRGKFSSELCRLPGGDPRGPAHDEDGHAEEEGPGGKRVGHHPVKLHEQEHGADPMTTSPASSDRY